MTSNEQWDVAMAMCLAYAQAFPDTVVKDGEYAGNPTFRDFMSSCFYLAVSGKEFVAHLDEGRFSHIQRQMNVETAAHNIANAVVTRYIADLQTVVADAGAHSIKLSKELDSVADVYKQAYLTAVGKLMKN